jgi:FkbM family methyltransferase
MGTYAKPVPAGKKVVLGILRTYIVLGAVVIVGAVALQLYPPIFPWGVAVLGGSACASGDVFRGAQTRLALADRRQAIQAELRVVEEDSEGYVLWEYSGGSFWVPKGSESSLAIILAQQEVNEYGDAQQGVRPGDVVLDCGAHIGIYTRKALRQGAKLVVAIEPAPANLECLRRNLKGEIASGQVIIYPKGVWDKEEILPLFEDPSNSASDRFVAPDETTVSTHSIPLVPIDVLVRELDLPPVTMIKMDIKGATAKALRGSTETLLQDRPRLVISTEEYIDSLDEITSVVESLGLGYRRECGSCSLRSAFEVYPDVVFFRLPGANIRDSEASMERAVPVERVGQVQ